MNKKMKKLGLYTMALLSLGLVACNQDFETEFVPQTNLPESKLQMSDISFAANTETTIKLSDYINEEAGTEKPILIGTVSVKEGAMPDNTTLKAEVEFSKSADFDESVVLEADIDEKNVISVKASRLQESYFNGITRNPAETPLYMRTTLYTVTGGSSVAVVGKPGENYYAQRNVQFTPLNKVQISPAYYVIGAAAGWSADGARTQKFSHSSADVYDDPIFTIVVDAGGDDCWFAIGDDAALDAIANDNDWTKLFGTKGASEDLTGTMDFRYNLGGDHSFHVTGAKKLKITLNMLEYTYTIQPINVADAYYLVGGPEDWAGSAASKSQKFSHSSASVADDPIFTYVLEGTGGDIWFAIGDDEACDAIANDNDWTKLFGTKGASEDLTGTMDYRYNLGGDHSFHVTGAKKIRITLDMLEYTYKIEPVNISDAYYLIGGPGEWNAESAMTMQFAHSNADVFDDPVFTYTFEGSGSDMWFAFGDKDAIDSVAEGTWNKLFGTTGASEDLSGSFDRRYNLDGDHSFHIDGTAKFYRFSINMSDMTYTITPLNFAEYIWEAGVNNNWGADAQPLYCGDGNGTYVGFFYAQDADWSGGKGAFKFTGAFNDWSQGNYGTGTINDDGLSGTLIDDGGSGNVLAEPGFYRAEVNLAAMTYKLTPVQIGIIGPAQAGGWSDDTDMTYNPETRAWEATIALTAGEFKFRANDGWDINWGGSVDNLTQDGANLSIDADGTYFIQFFATCETKSYCVITKK